MSGFTLSVEWARLAALQGKAEITAATALVDGQTRAQLKSAVDAQGRLVAKLAPTGAYGWATLNHEAGWTEAKWVGLANEVAAALIYTCEEIAAGEYSIAGFWQEVVLPTAREAGEGVKDVIKATPSLLNTVAVIAVALAVIYVARVFR